MTYASGSPSRLTLLSTSTEAKGLASAILFATHPSKPSGSSIRRAGGGPALSGYYGDEDLAVRPLRRGVGWTLHLRRRPTRGFGAFPQNPVGRRKRDGRKGRVPLSVGPSDRQKDSPGPGGVRAVLVRGPSKGRRPRGFSGVRRFHPRARDRQRDALRSVRLPGADEEGRSRDSDARRKLVRRYRRGEEDRHDGRGLPPPRSPTRLHRAGGSGRFDPPLSKLAQRPHPEDGTSLLHRLVQGARHRTAGGLRRSRLPAGGAGSGDRTFAPPGRAP